MAKVTSGYFTEDRAPELRFEESRQGNAPMAKRVGNQGATLPIAGYGVEEDRYAELHDKKANMLRLQEELEKTQREANDLEVRRGKEERFNHGRREICERLARNLAKLDRELYNAQKAVEEISSAREGYQQHLDTLRALQLDAAGQADDEMDRAIGAVEDAENEFSKTTRRLSSVLPKLGVEAFAPQAGSAPHKFSAWLCAGTAFSVPLAIAAILVALVLKHLA